MLLCVPSHNSYTDWKFLVKIVKILALVKFSLFIAASNSLPPVSFFLPVETKGRELRDHHKKHQEAAAAAAAARR